MRRSARTACIVLGVATICAGCSPRPPASEDPRGAVVHALPFEVQGQERADYVGNAFAGSLAANLALAIDVEVVPVTEHTGSTAPPDADRATHRLSGSLIREGESLRVRARLHDVASGTLTWETELDSETGELGNLAYRLARQTAAGLGKSYPALYEYIWDMSGGPEMSASPLTRRVRRAWRQYDVDDLLRLSSELLAAHGGEPTAHAIEAAALSILLDTAPTEELLERLKDRIAGLDRIDASSPYDELLRAYLYRSSGRPKPALALYSSVLARDDLSSRARSWTLRQRSYAQLQAGNPAAARDGAEAAVRHDPAEAASLFALSRALEASGELEASIERSKQALALDPSWWRGHQRLGLVLSHAQRHDEAVASLDRACRQSDVQEPCANLAVGLMRAGREADARSAADHADSLVGSPWGLYNLACYEAVAGEAKKALGTLARAVEHGFADMLITRDSDLDSLRSDPAFEALVAEVRDRISARQRLLEAAFPWQS